MSISVNKLYSKSGDDGFTNLISGKRVKKISELVELCGNLEELNVFLGYVAESLYSNPELVVQLKQVYRIQKELFEIIFNLTSEKKFVINPHSICDLEYEINAMSERLPVLQSMILPGGGEIASRIYLAWAVCRRAERSAFRLFTTNDNAETVGIYLNRLSEWLYVAARTMAVAAGVEETTVSHLKV